MCLSMCIYIYRERERERETEGERERFTPHSQCRGPASDDVALAAFFAEGEAAVGSSTGNDRVESKGPHNHSIEIPTAAPPGTQTWHSSVVPGAGQRIQSKLVSTPMPPTTHGECTRERGKIGFY